MATLVKHFRANSVPGSPAVGNIHYIPVGADEYVQYVTDNTGQARLPAVLAHPHEISDVNGLQSALDGKLSQATADGRYVSLGSYGSPSLNVSSPDLHAVSHTGFFYATTPSSRPSGSNSAFVLSGAYSTAAVQLVIDQAVDGGIWLKRKTGGSWQADRQLATQYWVGSQSFATQSWVTSGFVDKTSNQTDIAGNKSWTGHHRIAPSNTTGLTAEPASIRFTRFSSGVQMVMDDNAGAGALVIRAANGGTSNLYQISLFTGGIETGNHGNSNQWNSAYIWVSTYGSGLQGGPYVPQSRTITINGQSYDLSANRSWTITGGGATLTAGDGISGSSYDGSTNRTWSLDTTWLNSNYVNRSSGQSGIAGNKAWTGHHAIAPANTSELSAATYPNSMLITRGNNGVYQNLVNSSGAVSSLLRSYAVSGIQLTLNEGGVATSAHGTSANWNSAYAWVNTYGSGLQGGPYTPTSRTLTINGQTYDLTANRSWTVTASNSTLTRGTGLTGSNYNGTSGTTWAVDFGTGTNQAARGDHTHSGYVPTSRTITINGQSYDLTQNRSWTVGGSNWTVNGSDIYRNTGNVGIGTSSPGEKLAVVGSFSATGNSAFRPDGSGNGTVNIWRNLAIGDAVNDVHGTALIHNGINTGDINTKLAFEVRSTTRGSIPFPKMSQTNFDDITSKPEGTFYWNTTQKGFGWFDGSTHCIIRLWFGEFYGWNGTTWLKLSP